MWHTEFGIQNERYQVGVRVSRYHMAIQLLGIMILWGCMLAPWAAAEPHYIREIWLDAQRQRHVNVRMSFAASRQQDQTAHAQPIFIFSLPQGWRWGGHQDHYEYLATELAQRGVVMITVSHYDAMETANTTETFADIYPDILTGNQQDAAVDRYEDIRFILGQLTRINAEQRATWPSLDLDTIAVGGHSSGVLTALHLAGLPVRDRFDNTHAVHSDTRIKAFVIFGYPMEHSSPKHADVRQVSAIPGLHIVGADDHPEFRHASHRLISGAPQYWLVAEGGHAVGSKGPLPLLQDAVGHFISTYLLKDLNSRKALTYDYLKRHGSALRSFKVKEKDAPTWRLALDRRNFVAWLRDTLPWGMWLHDQAKAHYLAQQAQVQ